MTIDTDKLRALHEAANSKVMHPEDVASARFALKNFVMSYKFPGMLAELDAMRTALSRIIEIDQHQVAMGKPYDGSCAAIARAALQQKDKDDE